VQYRLAPCSEEEETEEKSCPPGCCPKLALRCSIPLQNRPAPFSESKEKKEKPCDAHLVALKRGERGVGQRSRPRLLRTGVADHILRMHAARDGHGSATRAGGAAGRGMWEGRRPCAALKAKHTRHACSPADCCVPLLEASALGERWEQPCNTHTAK